MRIMLALVILAPACATAQDGRAVAIATGTDGATITLHEGRGPCVGEARFAVYRAADGSGAIPGCWRVATGGVFISFLDGERADIPASHLRKVSAT